MKGAVTILICATTLFLAEAHIFKKLQEDEPENEIINDDPSLAPIICAAEGSNGVLVAHEDCSKFYVCNNGRRVVMPCPPNLFYNPITKQCDWAENVKCPARIPDAEVDIQTAPRDDSVEDKVVNDDYNLADTICAAKDSSGVLVASKYCNRFYKCTHGVPVALRCPLNLLYNPIKEQCDWPDNVECGTRVIPSPDADKDDDNALPDDDVAADDESEEDKVVNDDYNLAPAICAAEESDGVLVANEYCNLFYKCNNKRPVPLRCPRNLFYNPRKEQCDWRDNVDCGTRIIPEPDTDAPLPDNDEAADDDSEEEKVVNDDYTLAPTICAAEGSDGVLVAHQYCNKFNKCAHGVAVALSCQLNLLYNPRREWCDWPENVDCNGRLI